ncbi:MAG: hypothetical protein EA360_10300 [Balneolaceae bacterium]|nr:MAG: hypothetical protein EA360_10300 [Balneolaceae bacterium]
METISDKHVDDLAGIIKALADVWPNDRENVMVAGAAFEQFVGEMEPSGVQINKLIDLSWKGMRHLFEEDAFFISVKNATMQGVNTIREYLLSEGQISVEEFEKSCERLESALQGAAESADKIIDVDDEGKPVSAAVTTVDEPPAEIADTAEEEQEKSEPEAAISAVSDEAERDLQPGSPERDAPPVVEAEITLNTLATRIMEAGEDAGEAELREIFSMLEYLAAVEADAVATSLNHAAESLSKALDSEDFSSWYAEVSDCVEAAMAAEEDEEWEQEQAALATATEDPSAEESIGSGQVMHAQTETEESADEVFIISEDIDLDMLTEFVAECNDLIETAESALLDLEEKPSDSELINTVFRAFHTIKGTSAFMGLDPISEFTHSAETLLDLIRDGKLSFDRPSADICLDSIDIIKKLLQIVSTAKGGSELQKSPQYKATLLVLVDIAENGTSPGEALAKTGISNPVIPEFDEPLEELQSENSAEAAPEPVTERLNGAPEEPGQKSDTEATVRVNLGRLDRLIDMVGELVIAHSVVSQDELISKEPDLMKKVDHTSKILRELQDTSLTLRMVPLKATFHKMNRLVRDLARKAGKNVKLSTIGDDTEIDRNMVDIINEPLVHMLRNSIDHGVESPEERAAAGKSATANVWLRAFQEGGKVVIEIEDDGKGINKEKILEKAIAKGLVATDKKLTDKEICGLIFHPGLSSVDKVTDLSGRGVGMDVVRRSIEQLQGKVEVESHSGKGTKVSLELPFTLAITDGMLVSVGSQKFIIPTINIEMTFRAQKADIFTILGTSEQVKYRGNSVPILRLHKLFTIYGAMEELDGGTLVIIKNNSKLYALLVDEILGQQQLVGKSINMNVKMPHISGGAILGDGKVGLILDTAAVVL